MAEVMLSRSGKSLSITNSSPKSSPAHAGTKRRSSRRRSSRETQSAETIRAPASAERQIEDNDRLFYCAMEDGSYSVLSAAELREMGFDDLPEFTEGEMAGGNNEQHPQSMQTMQHVYNDTGRFRNDAAHHNNDDGRSSSIVLSEVTQLPLDPALSRAMIPENNTPQPLPSMPADEILAAQKNAMLMQREAMQLLQKDQRSIADTLADSAAAPHAAQAAAISARQLHEEITRQREQQEKLHRAAELNYEQAQQRQYFDKMRAFAESVKTASMQSMSTCADLTPPPTMMNPGGGVATPMHFAMNNGQMYPGGMHTGGMHPGMMSLPPQGAFPQGGFGALNPQGGQPVHAPHPQSAAHMFSPPSSSSIPHPMNMWSPFADPALQHQILLQQQQQQKQSVEYSGENDGPNYPRHFRQDDTSAAKRRNSLLGCFVNGGGAAAQ